MMAIFYGHLAKASSAVGAPWAEARGVERDGLDQRLTWDALDRLVRIEDQNFIEEPIEFTYDGQGRRVSADRTNSAQRYVVGPTGNQSLESPHLVHNGAFLTGELVYGGEHALWRYDGAEPPATRVYLRDAMGSVIGLMDQNGQLLETFEYDAFGNVRNPGGEALPEVSFGGDSRFQGMWKDAGTGLYYVRARYYDARTGRFLSRDPAEGQLEQPESFYPYVFANGNPYVFRDPTGLFTTADVMATVNAISAFATVSLGSGGAQRFLTLLRSAIQPATQVVQQLGPSTARFVEIAKNSGLNAVRALQAASRTGSVAASRNIRAFEVAPRVAQQLSDPRLGSLAGKLSPERLQNLINSPAASRFLDANTGNINVIQQVNGRLLRITVARDAFRIISVGAIRHRNVINGIARGRFIRLP